MYDAACASIFVKQVLIMMLAWPSCRTNSHPWPPRVLQVATILHVGLGLGSWAFGPHWFRPCILIGFFSGPALLQTLDPHWFVPGVRIGVGPGSALVWVNRPQVMPFVHKMDAMASFLASRPEFCAYYVYAVFFNPARGSDPLNLNLGSTFLYTKPYVFTTTSDLLGVFLCETDEPWALEHHPSPLAGPWSACM